MLDRTPMMTADVVEMYPAAGVTAASPAMEPVNNPTNLGFFSKIHAIKSQVMAAKEAATSVFKNASAVIGSTRSSLPALNTHQPNHKRPVPRATRGMLWGPRSCTFLRPRNNTDASAENPA